MAWNLRRARRWIPARARTVLAALVAGVVVMLTAVAPASADQFRSAEPFTAGTPLTLPSKLCTAGLVLKDHTWAGSLTEYRQSIRYILTAGHCGSVGEMVTTRSGLYVGKVIWKSDSHDFLLIQVDPERRLGYAPGCNPSSGMCVGIRPHYYPRAVGRVLNGSAPMSSTLPVTGTIMPPPAASFCVSAGLFGASCGHRNTATPPDYRPRPGQANPRFFVGPIGFHAPGDSGAPVYSTNGSNAAVFGIFTGAWGPAGGGPAEQVSGVYTPVMFFFADVNNRYTIAPN